MDDTVIRVEGLGKRYHIGAQQAAYDTLRDALRRSLTAPFHRAAALLKRHNGAEPETTIWALKDVSFEVKYGEVLGIIGRNGAGKSTLLKILSRITEPSEGRAVIHGRMGALLEVGTGFHPELTGRENIYLNGAILGMRRVEIDRKFDEIVDFSEIEKFIDTPVKHYSSGMAVRLAFSVAAHLEPEILMVDEVLAVGDVAFQRKCLGKMGDVAQAGRTVLFVSHNMAAVENLCSRAILLKEGSLIANGPVSDVIAAYISNMTGFGGDGANNILNRAVLQAQNNPDFCITGIELLSGDGNQPTRIQTGDPVIVRIHYRAERQLVTPAFGVRFKTITGQEVIRLSTLPISGYHIEQLAEKGYIDLHIMSLPLTAGRYYLDVGLAREMFGWEVYLEHVVALDVMMKDVYGSGTALSTEQGLIVVPHTWTHRQS